MTFTEVLERLTKLENPYPGLRPFEAADAHLYFGRDQQVLDLLERLAGNRFVAVLGLSGSGKSSLVRAGVVPALQTGRLLESGLHWRVAIMQPGGAPFARLAAALSSNTADLRATSHGLITCARPLLSKGEALLLFVDQFEELFRYKDVASGSDADHASASDAAAFIELLLTSTRSALPIYVVITMRTDYLGDCAEFPDFPEALNESQYLVPRLTREQRRQAIEGPLGTVRISSALVERILNDAGDEPDQLPVLQHALMRTWAQWYASQSRDRRPIGIEDYLDAGGFEGALDQHANELLATSPARENSPIVEILFRRLTALGRGNRERRDPAPLSELWDLCQAVTEEQRRPVNDIVNLFRQKSATFLAPRGGELQPDTYIDIAHESLIRQWKLLRDQWLPAEEKQANALIDILQRARAWERGEGELLVGIDLSGALAWNRERPQSAKWSEHYIGRGGIEEVARYLAASNFLFEESERAARAQNERDLAKEQQLREEAEKRALVEHLAGRRTRQAATLLLLALLVSSALSIVALVQRQRARNEKAWADQARKQLVSSNEALDNIRRQLLAQNGWTEDRLRLAATDPQLVNESLAAGQALLKLSAPSANILILYHPKSSEPAIALVQNWQSQGYKVERIPAMNDEAADVLWYRGPVSVIDLKRIALTLIRAGLKIRAIRHLEGQGPTKAEVGYDPEFSDLPPWSVDEIVRQSSFDEPRTGSGKAYVEVRFPSDSERTQVYHYLDSHAIKYKVTLKNGRVSTISTNLTDEAQATQLYQQMQAAGLGCTLMHP